MALDEYFFSRVESGRIDGILRLYDWEPGSISIGYFCKTEDFNREKIRQDGIKVVRRLTGGSSIYHNDDITY